MIFSIVYLLLVLGNSFQVNPVSIYAQSTPANRQSRQCMAMVASEQLPSTSRTLSDFESIKAETSIEEVFQRVGCPDTDIGSGIHIYVYQLADGSQVWIGTPGENIFYVDLRRDGELIERLVGDLPIDE